MIFKKLSKRYKKNKFMLMFTFVKIAFFGCFLCGYLVNVYYTIFLRPTNYYGSHLGVLTFGGWISPLKAIIGLIWLSDLFPNMNLDVIAWSTVPVVIVTGYYIWFRLRFGWLYPILYSLYLNMVIEAI